MVLPPRLDPGCLMLPCLAKGQFWCKSRVNPLQYCSSSLLTLIEYLIIISSSDETLILCQQFRSDKPPARTAVFGESQQLMQQVGLTTKC